MSTSFRAVVMGAWVMGGVAVVAPDVRATGESDACNEEACVRVIQGRDARPRLVVTNPAPDMVVQPFSFRVDYQCGGRAVAREYTLPRAIPAGSFLVMEPAHAPCGDALPVRTSVGFPEVGSSPRAGGGETMLGGGPACVVFGPGPSGCGKAPDFKLDGGGGGASIAAVLAVVGLAMAAVVAVVVVLAVGAAVGAGTGWLVALLMEREPLHWLVNVALMDAPLALGMLGGTAAVVTGGIAGYSLGQRQESWARPAAAAVLVGGLVAGGVALLAGAVTGAALVTGATQLLAKPRMEKDTLVEVQTLPTSTTLAPAPRGA